MAELRLGAPPENTTLYGWVSWGAAVLRPYNRWHYSCELEL